MQFSICHPDTLHEVEQDARIVSQDFSTSYAYRDLQLAFADYLRIAARRDVCDVASELEHMQRRISRVLAS